MPAQRLPMRQVREVLRLKHAASFSERGIAASLGISRTTVAEYLRRAAVVGITWPVPDELDDAEREQRLTQFLDRSEVLNPQQVLLQSPDEALGTTVSLRRTDEGR